MLKLCKTAVTIKSKTTHYSWWCFLCQQNTSHKQGNTTEWWSKLVILHLDTWKPETFASQVLEDEQRSGNGQRFHWHAAIGNNGWARCQWLGHCCWWCSTDTVQAKFGSGHISWCCISHMTTRWAWFSGHNTCLGEKLLTQSMEHADCSKCSKRLNYNRQSFSFGEWCRKCESHGSPNAALSFSSVVTTSAPSPLR